MLIDLPQRGVNGWVSTQSGIRKIRFIQATGPGFKESAITAGPVMRNHIKGGT